MVNRSLAIYDHESGLVDGSSHRRVGAPVMMRWGGGDDLDARARGKAVHRFYHGETAVVTVVSRVVQKNSRDVFLSHSGVNRVGERENNAPQRVCQKV